MRPLAHGRGLVLLDIARGFATAYRCAGQALHNRAFVGLLGLPVATNIAAAVTLAGGAALAWTPLCQLFASEWPLLDAWRQGQQDRAPFVLTLTTAWLLWPIWFEVVGGGSLDPLVAATEVAIAGGPMRQPATPRAGSLAQRVHRRARLFATKLLLLPLAWLLALLPYVGLPLVFMLTSALAAMVWLELPAERRDVDPAAHRRDLRHNWARAFGLGMALQLGVLVPVFDLLLLAPAAAVAAATVYLQLDKGGAASDAGAQRRSNRRAGTSDS